MDTLLNPVEVEPFNPMSDREDRVDAAIALFLQAADEGRPIGVSEFLQQHADLADELREFLQDQAAFRSVTSGLRQTLSGLAVPSKNSDLVWRPEDELPRGGFRGTSPID